MSLIKRFNELETPKTVKMMVYGVAGCGKTTLALSTPSPLLLDFDNGVHRVNIEHLKDVSTVQVKTWQDVKQLFGMGPGTQGEDLSDFRTVVVDTIGKMMDYIITHVAGNRQPRIQDWGTINSEFQNFVRALSNLGKHVVFVAHRDTKQEGDDLIFIPALREKNYSTIITELDLLGYVEMLTQNGVTHRSITFNPTPRNDGKNTCNLPAVMNISDLIDKQGNVAENTWVTDNVIKPYMGMLSQKQEAVNEYNNLLEEITKDIQAITNAEGANKFAKKIGDYQHVGASFARARHLYGNRVNELGLVYDKDTRLFSDPQKVSEPQPQAQQEVIPQPSNSLL